MSTNDPTVPAGDGGEAPQPPNEGTRTLRSVDLLQGEREVLIEHRGEIYRLRVTRNDKLILQK